VFERVFLLGALRSARVSLQAANASRPLNVLSTDSRKLARDDVFFALAGEVFDGHDFIEAAVRAQVGMVIAQQWPARLDANWFGAQELPVPDVVLVADSRKAYGEIARAWRMKSAAQVAAVTGSNGKTTVKEMLARIAAAQFGDANSLATVGNLNNDIGVPQMLLRLAPEHQAAVFELGMNHPGEIAWLAYLAQAQVALVLNAQREHQEFMSSVRATAVENGAALQALPAHGFAVFPGDEEFTTLWGELAANTNQMRFGWAANQGQADQLALKVWSVEPTAESLASTRMVIHSTNTSAEVELALLGAHNRRNALAAAATALAMGCSTDAIRAGLAAMQPVKGRLVRHAWHAGALIDDTYNANPDSVRAAIDVLALMPGQKVLILGDMGEVGEQGPQFHAEVGVYAAESGINTVLGLGSATRNTIDAVNRFAAPSQPAAGQWFAQDMEALLEAAHQRVQPGATVLVKGSRFMKMERVVQALLEEAHHAA
jgi:UDP-N-acetylmuramoyl-tripeptide--D-alanyl-D-alanine ligase